MAFRARRGLTLIEMLFALFVVFFAVCTLAGVMVSTYSWFHRLQDRSSSVQLAAQSVRETLWDGAQGNFVNNTGYPELTPFGENDNWWTSFPPYSPVFNSMNTHKIYTQTPTGTTVEFEIGWHWFGQGGLAVKNNGEIGYGIYYGGAETIGIFNDQNGQMIATYPKMPVRVWTEPGHIPVPPNPGGMCWDSVTNTVYVADVGDGGTYPISNPETGGWVGNPTGPGGVSIALVGANVWGTSGHLLWNDAELSMGTSTNTNSTPIVPLPPNLALGEATILAIDPNDTTSMWVTDEKFMCIRHYMNSGTASANNFEPYEYKIAAGQRMGCPQLMVMVSLAGVSTLIVYDGTSIWQFPAPMGGVLTPSVAPCVIPPLAGAASLHAIGANQVYAAGAYVFFTDSLDRLYRYTVATNTFNPIPIH